MMKMTLTAHAAHELSHTAKERLNKEVHTEAIHLVEGYITRSIKEACDKGVTCIQFKFPKEDRLIWDYIQIILRDNEYKTFIKPDAPILVVKW